MACGLGMPEIECLDQMSYSFVSKEDSIMVAAAKLPIPQEAQAVEKVLNKAGTAGPARQTGTAKDSGAAAKRTAPQSVKGRKAPVSASGGAAAAGGARYAAIFKAPPQERIDVIRAGISARVIGELSARLDVSKDSLSEVLGIPRATLNRKAREGKVLARDESERVLGMQALIGQVETMMEESGDPAMVAGFDAARWVAGWLKQPLRALGGQTPASYMDTVEGQKLVSNLLAMAQSGAYA